MKVIVNGNEANHDAGTLSELVAEYNLQKGLVVTEVNGKIIDRSDWESTELTEGMKIEIVHFVGGG